MNKLALTVCSTAIKLIAILGCLAIFSRSLSLDEFSYLILGLLIAQVASIFIDAGINNEILRYARTESEEESQSRLERSTAVRLFLGGVVFLACIAYSLIAIKAWLNSALFLSAYLSGILASICESYLINIKSKNKFTEEFYFVLTQSLLILTLPALSNLSPWFAIPAILVPRAITYAVLSRKKTSTAQKTPSCLSINEIKNYYTNLKFYSIDSIFSNINIQADAILISTLAGKEAYALYQPLSKIYTAGIGFAAAIASYFVPLATTYSNPSKQLKLLNLAFIFFGSLGALVFWMLSGKVVILFFGSQFITDPQTILLLALIMAARYATAGSGSFMTIAGKQKHRALINSTTTIACIATALTFARTINEILMTILATQIFVFILSAVFSASSRPNDTEKHHAHKNANKVS